MRPGNEIILLEKQLRTNERSEDFTRDMEWKNGRKRVENRGPKFMSFKWGLGILKSFNSWWLDVNLSPPVPQLLPYAIHFLNLGPTPGIFCLFSFLSQCTDKRWILNLTVSSEKSQNDAIGIEIRTLGRRMIYALIFCGPLP